MLTESVAESDVDGDVPGPALQQLHRRFAKTVADPAGLATYAEFIKLVGAAAPSRSFVEDEWEDRKDESNTIGFDDFRVVMKKIEVRQTVVIVVTATVVAVFFNYMKVSTQLVSIFMPSDVINDVTYLSADWDAPAYTSEHIATMVAAAITLIIFTFGAPVAALGVLIYMRIKDRLHEPEIFTMFGFLYAGYKPKYFWWESMVLLRKVASTVIALAPIGLQLQAISAAVLLGFFIVIQLIVCPFKNQRHNVLDCMAMSSITLKQLCALAYHHVVTNAVDTLASRQLVSFTSWVVSAIVLTTSIALVVFFVGQFLLFKREEMNEERRATVAAEQEAWRRGVPMEPTKAQRVLECLKCGKCGRVPTDERDGEAVVEEEEEEAGVTGGVRRDGDGGEMAAVAAATVAAIGKSIETYELEMKRIKDERAAHIEGVKDATARMEAMRVEHNKVTALRLIAGETIGGDGMIVMAREPLTVSGLVKAKVRRCMCRGKLFAWFNTETGEVLDPKEHVLAAAAIDPAAGAITAGGAEDGGAARGGGGGARVSGVAPELELTATLNPFGIAMRAMQQPDPESDTHSEEDDVEQNFAFVPPGGFRSCGSTQRENAAVV